MHEIEFSHLHVTPEEQEHLGRAIWSADNVELTTVGLDVGSSTTHLMFARVHLQRLSTSLSSRFVVAGREILWRSPIHLTPYRADFTIDAERLAGITRAAYGAAGLARDDVDSGAVILTGEALKRHNAGEIAALFAEESGKFVCATAGHHLEAALAAQGAGAVALSRQKAKTILNVDIGGGTTKFALVAGGEVLATAAVAVGGRLAVVGDDGELERIETPLKTLADRLEIPLRVDQRGRLAREMARILIALIRQEPARGVARELLLTEPLPATPKPEAITFSGGVAEYLFGRETRNYGDLGPDLAQAITHGLGHGAVPLPVWDPGQGIRATVIGAAQFTVQVSGNTILISDPARLPLRNIPVLSCGFALGEEIDRAAVIREVRRALARHGLGRRRHDGRAGVRLARRPLSRAPA